MFKGERKPPVIMREGKTARDKASGAPGRAASNAEARANWSRTTHRGKSKEPFPQEVCNGKESRALRVIRRKKGRDSGGSRIEPRGGER